MILRAEKVGKKFRLGEHEIPALKGVDLEVAPGEFLAIAGSSGSGKTTLLNLLACLDVPTSGRILVDGVDVRGLGERELAAVRADKIGFVFQTFNLLPVLTAFENVEYPLLLKRVPARERERRCRKALERVGLSRHADHRPDQLSGGQRQRVAIARALVKEPRIILADEPTANLDSKTAIEILSLMQELNSVEKTTFVFSSHDPLILERVARQVKIADGSRVA